MTDKKQPHVIRDGKADRPGSGLWGRLTGDELQAALRAHLASLPPSPIDLRALVRAELDRRGDGALTALATAVWKPWGMSTMQDARSAISRWLKGSRADGARASLPLHALELILGHLGAVVTFPTADDPPR